MLPLDSWEHLDMRMARLPSVLSCGSLSAQLVEMSEAFIQLSTMIHKH